MKHIKLFEGFMETSKYLLGYFADGGHGSHPGILTADVLLKNGFTPNAEANYYGNETWTNESAGIFAVIEVLDHVPEAIGLSMDTVEGMWNFKEVPTESAEMIISRTGMDTVYQEDSEFSKAVSLIGWRPSANHLKYKITEPDAVSFIINPQPNFIYWSENPEMAHGYWQEGQPIEFGMLVQQYMDDYDENEM